MRHLRLILVAAASCAAAPATAHPHVWVEATAEIVFDAAGRLSAIRQHWRFDDAFTAFALQGFDEDGDGRYTPEELRPLARVNVESLAEYGYFTRLLHGTTKLDFGAVEDYGLALDGERLVLSYTLPLAAAVPPDREITLQVYDPDYFVDLSFPDAAAARLDHAPADCLIDVRPASGPGPDAAAILAGIGADERELPPGMRGMTAGIENTAIVDCGPDAAKIQAERAAPHSAGDAAAMMATGIPSDNIDLTAGAPAPADGR